MLMLKLIFFFFVQHNLAINPSMKGKQQEKLPGYNVAQISQVKI